MRTRSKSMARLGEDLIVDILSRLPVKSLLRFKCVSKRWCYLISDPQLAKTQLRRATEGNNTSAQRIIIVQLLLTINYEAVDGEGADEGAALQLHTPGSDPDQLFMLAGHCDGLVCLACGGGYMLYNPTTRQSRAITPSGLAIEIDQINVIYGFGYDPTTHDYKVLQGMYITSANGSKEAALEILALKSNSWRRIENSRVTTDPYGVGIYLNGALHWIGGRTPYQTIVSFDLAEEKFKQVLQLPDTGQETRFEGLGVHGARLFTYEGTHCDRFKAWIMNEYGRKESWAELFNVSMGEIVLPAKYYAKPLCYTTNRKIVFDVDGREVYSFNPDDITLRELPTGGADWESAIYIESLISPYVGCEGP